MAALSWLVYRAPRPPPRRAQASLRPRLRDRAVVPSARGTWDGAGGLLSAAPPARAPPSAALSSGATACALAGEDLGQLVALGSGPRSPRTCALSTSSSLTALQGDLISGGASRLDAFSAYPVRTRLPCDAAGATAGTPEVRPTRSSRTNVSSPQISSAHNR